MKVRSGDNSDAFSEFQYNSKLNIGREFHPRKTSSGINEWFECVVIYSYRISLSRCQTDRDMGSAETSLAGRRATDRCE